MPGLHCPPVCPCRGAGYGAALAAAAIYAAAAAPMFLGAHFWVLLTAFWRAPSSAPLALVIWAAVLVAGLITFGVGVVARARERDVTISGRLVVAGAVAAIVLFEGWTLPRLSLFWLEAGRGLCWSLIAAAVVEVAGSVMLRVWWRGFFAGGADAESEIDQLRDECNALRFDLHDASRGDDLRRLVELIGGRRAVLALLHPDGKPEAEKSAATVRFQQAGELLARIERGR